MKIDKNCYSCLLISNHMGMKNMITFSPKGTWVELKKKLNSVNEITQRCFLFETLGVKIFGNKILEEASPMEEKLSYSH